MFLNPISVASAHQAQANDAKAEQAAKSAFLRQGCETEPSILADFEALLFGDEAPGAALPDEGLPHPCVPNTVENQELGTAPATSITGAMSSRKEKVKGGLDWLAVSIEGEWTDEAWTTTHIDLCCAKAEAEERNDTVAVEVAGRWWAVKPRGAMHQNGYADIVAECGGVTYHFSKKQHALEGRPLVWVRIGSIPLMMAGHVAMWAEVCETLAALGIKQKINKVSRCDICVDLVGVALRAFVDKYTTDSYISRAKEDIYYRSSKKGTGLVFGTKLKCRIYDKLKELKKTGDEVKHAVMVEHRWGEVPGEAVRIEFQIDREHFRERFAVLTVENLFDRLPALAEYLCTDWLRFTEEPVDRAGKHQSRAEEWSVWAEVRELFAEAMGNGDKPIQRKEWNPPAPKGLLQQAAGCLKKYLAIQGVHTRSIPQNFAALRAQIWQAVLGGAGQDFINDIRQTANVYRERWPRKSDQEIGDEWRAKLDEFWEPVIAPG